MAYRSPVNHELFEKYKNQTEELKSGFQRILPLFNTKKEWADIERTLKKIDLHLQRVETPFLFQKPILFRRLAQCLNLKEEGIHQTVIKIYERILYLLHSNNEFLMNDAYFISIGMFYYLQNNLYQQNKHIYFLIKEYFLPMREQLGPMLPSLMSALFPALIESNPNAENAVFEILNKVSESVPKAYFYSCIWVVLFRSPSSRFGILKYMNSHLAELKNQVLPVFEDEFQSSQQIVLPENQSDHSDHQNDPLFNQIDQHTQSFNNELNSINEQPNTQNYDYDQPMGSVENAEGFPVVNEADNHQTEANVGETKSKKSKISDSEKANLKKSVNENSKTQSVVKQMTEVDEILLEEQQPLNAVPIIEYKVVVETDFNEYEVFRNHCHRNFQTWNEQITKNCKNELFPHKNMVISSLKESLSDSNSIIVQKTLDFIISFLPLQSNILSEAEKVLLLEPCLILLERSDYSIKRRIFKFVFKDFSEEEVDEEIDEYSIQMVVATLKVMFDKSVEKQETKVFKILQTIFMERECLIEPIVTGLTKEVLRLLSVLPEDEKETLGSSFFMSISTYFYIFTCAYVGLPGESLCESEFEVLIRFGNTHLVFKNEQNEVVERVPVELVKYHQLKFGGEKAVAASRIADVSVLVSFNRFQSLKTSKVDSMIGSQLKPELFDNEEEELEFEGNNIAHLIRMRVFQGYLSMIDFKPFVSSRAFDSFLTITNQWTDFHFNTQLHALAVSVLHKFKMSLVSDDFQSINDHVFESMLRVSVYLLKKLNDNTLINEWSQNLSTFLVKHGNNPLYCLASIRGIIELIQLKNTDIFKKLNEAAIKSSWRLMDDLRFHQQAFMLINELGKFQIQLMIEILKAKLADREVSVKMESLQRIVVFWRISASQNEKFNTPLDEDLTCLLLDQIDDPHPVVRQLAKSWLFDSSAFLDRILDPIMRRLIVNCRLFITVPGHYFHVNVFKVVDVMEAFKRLDTVIANNPTKVSNFILSNRVNSVVKQILEERNDENNFKNETYSSVLMGLSIRYLRASVLQFMGRQFCQDNLLVATAACELLEQLIKQLQNVMPSFLSESLVEDLLKTYYQFVDNEVSTMQVNMINLMKVILFQSGFLERNKRNLALFERIFREKKLLEQVIGSISKNRNSHTLLKIVDFLDTTIEIFSSGFFPENKLKDVVSLVFQSYFRFIVEDDASFRNKNKFDSIVVLIEAVFKLITKYLGLDEFEIPDSNKAKRGILFRIFSFGFLQGPKQKDKGVPFKLLEAYFLEYFDKLMLVLLKGWKYVVFEEGEYHFCNLGPFGFDQIHADLKSQRVVKEAIDDFKRNEEEEEDEQGEEDSLDRTMSDSDQEISEQNEVFELEVESPPDEVVPQENLNLKIHQKQYDQLLLMTEKLYYKYPKYFLESLLKSWFGSYTNFSSENAHENNLFQAKIIDILSFFGFSISEFNKLLSESEFLRENQTKFKKSSLYISLAKGRFDCALLALYYGFLKYKRWAFIEDLDSRKTALRETWYAVCNFLQQFTRSTHPQVDIWVVNIYHLCAKKFPTQEIIGEYSIKKTIHVHENEVLEKIINFICDDNKSKLTFEKNERTESFVFVYPLPPLIVDLSFQQKSLYLAKLAGQFEEDFHLRYYTKVIALKALKQLTMELLKMTYDNKTNNRIARRVRNIIEKLFVYIESLLKNKLAINENLYVEIIEYMFIFLEDSRDFLMADFQGPIEKFFDSDLFFECPSKSLLLWSKIMYWQSGQTNKKILNKYVNKSSKQHELFVALFHSIKPRQNSVQRLPSFVLHPLLTVNSKEKQTTYSGQKPLLDWSTKSKASSSTLNRNPRF